VLQELPGKTFYTLATHAHSLRSQAQVRKTMFHLDIPFIN